MILSEDYYGFRKKQSKRVIHRTQLSEEKLNTNRSRQKQRLDDLKLQKLKQKYNQINNTNNGMKGSTYRLGRDKDKSKQRSKSKKNKFFHHQNLQEKRLRCYHYNDQPTKYTNQIRRRVEKKAMESLEKDFNNRFNIIEGRSCVNSKILRQGGDFLTRKSRKVCLKESLKSSNDKNTSHNGENKPISISQPHRIQKVKPEQKQPSYEQKMNNDEDESIDFDIQTQKIKLLRQKKLAYSQKQSMLLGTQTLQKKPKELSSEPKEQIKQILNQSVISINSRHDNNDQSKGQQLLQPEIKQPQNDPPRLATSDYELIKELEKRARDEQSQTSKVIQFNKVYPSSSSFSRSDANQNQDSQSNTLSNLIRNSSEIMKKNDLASSSQSSKRSLNRESRESISENSSMHLSKNSNPVSLTEPAYTKPIKGQKQTDTSQRRQPLPAYEYEYLVNRAYYGNNDTSLDISKGFPFQYLTYDNQYHYSNSASLKSSLQNQQQVDEQNGSKNGNQIKKEDQSSSPKFLLSEKQVSLQASKKSIKSQPSSIIQQNLKVANVNMNSISFDQYRNFVDNNQLLQSKQQHSTNTNGNKTQGNLTESVRQNRSADESMDGNKFSFVLQSNQQQNANNSNSPKTDPEPNIRQNVNISSFNHQSNASSMDKTNTAQHPNSNQAKMKSETSIMMNSLGSESMNQFMPVPPNIFVRPSQENLQNSYNLLSAIKDLNEEQDRKICNLYSTLGYENEGLQNLMDKLYEHVSCVNKLIDHVADTQTFYVDQTQREMFHVCSYLIAKRFSQQRFKILDHLRQGRSCFNLTSKQISTREIVAYVNTSTYNQFVKDLQSSNSKISKIIEFMYSRLYKEHSFLSPPQYPTSQYDLITISQKLNEELEMLIQKIEDNQEIRNRGGMKSSSTSSRSLRVSHNQNSFAIDNEYQALCQRAFGLMQLMFLISGLEGRNVKRLEKEIEAEDFEMYCKNNYGLFKETVLYFH